MQIICIVLWNEHDNKKIFACFPFSSLVVYCILQSKRSIFALLNPKLQRKDNARPVVVRSPQSPYLKKSLLAGRRRRPLDSRTRTTRRTRLNEKYFGVFSKKLIPRKGFIALFPPESWRCIDSFYQLFTPQKAHEKALIPSARIRGHAKMAEIDLYWLLL